MIRTNFLMTCWATLGVATACADFRDFETQVDAASTAAAPEERTAPATPEEPSDPFAAALAVLNGETSHPDQAPPEILPPLEDCLHPAERSTISSAALADGSVSFFRMDAEGVEKVSVSEDGGLSVGVTAVDSHVIEITGNGEVKPGTYTLIDYEGSISGAGFEGLTLRAAPHLHAKLVNNLAESKIELVIPDAAELEWAEAAREIENFSLSSLWAPLRKTTGIFGLLEFTPVDSTDDAVQ